MIYAFGDYELDVLRRELRCAGVPRAIEPQVFDVLACLVAASDRVVSRQELLDAVWGHRYVSDATLSSRVMAARKAVGDSGSAQRVIKTLHARGFRFVAPVTVRAAAPALASPAASATASPARLDGASATGGAASAPPLPPLAAEVPATERPVGRESELRHLAGWLEAALGGRRQLVFVTGEAGQGKTTLVEEFVRTARATRGVTVAHGQCLDLQGPGEPYLPVLEALGRLCRQDDGARVVALLRRHAPTWLAQLPWLVADDERDRLRADVEGTTRARMLREMAEALDALTAERALVLVLEDLHWSDRSTVDLLSSLARRPEPAHLLVIGTYRPADLKQAAHPLRTVAHELRVRGRCAELALPALDAAAIATYLAARLPGLPNADALVRLLQTRGSGNPLFVRTLVDHWIAAGLLVETPGGWAPAAPPEAFAAGVPESLQELIANQLDQLEPADQALLEVASVAGAEFSAAAVAAGARRPVEAVEACCTALALRGQLVAQRGSAAWPDGTLAARYAFLHHLYRDALYERIPDARRARLHREIGARLEAAHGERAATLAGELAAHFERGRDAARAISYLRLAADQALQRNAHAEAVDHLRRALDCLPGLTEPAERDAAELAVQAALAPALIPLQGWAVPAVEAAFCRARDLAAALGDTRELHRALYGLGTLYEYRGQYDDTRAVIEQRLRVSADAADAGLLAESHELLACSRFHQGVFDLALEHAATALEHFAAAEAGALASPLGKNAGLACHLWTAQALWFRGWPERAVARAREAVALAERLDHRYSLASAWTQAAYIHQFRREPELARQWAERAIALAEEQGFHYRLATARMVHGWALAALGRLDEGLAALRAGLADYEATGVRLELAYFLALLAEAHDWCGDPAEAGAALERALARVRASRGFFYEAELFRLRGNLARRAGRLAEAAADIEQALSVADRQGATLLALRAAVDQCELAPEDAAPRAALAARYAALDEGFDTPDLRRARAWCDAARADPRGS